MHSYNVMILLYYIIVTPVIPGYILLSMSIPADSDDPNVLRLSPKSEGSRLWGAITNSMQMNRFIRERSGGWERELNLKPQDVGIGSLW